MADTKRKVAHSLYRYTDEDGVERFAMRRDIVELSHAETKRGEELGALVPVDQPLVDDPGFNAGTVAADATGESDDALGDFPAAGSNEEQDAWIAKAKATDVTGYAEAHPDAKAELLAAEQRSSKPRSTVVDALSK
jgi:hypothetical protein